MTDSLTLGAPLDGWALPLSAVPDPVFAGGMMGGGIAIDPTGAMLHAPCDGVVSALHAAGHAVTLRTAIGAEILMHVGIDTVTLGGKGFASRVAEGEAVIAGQPLIAFDLDRVVRRARAAVTPMVMISGAGFAVTPLLTGGVVSVGDPLLRLERAAGDASAVRVSGGDAAVLSLTVALPHGIHARPAARIAAAARGRDASATLVCGPRRADALSMTELLGLGAAHGAALSIEARGSAAHDVVAAIAAIVTATSEPGGAVAAVPPPRPPRSLPPGALQGVAAAPGVAIGTALRWRAARPGVPAGTGDIDHERGALAAGLSRARAALDGGGGVLAAHRALLDDPALLDALAAQVTDGRSAAAAALNVTEVQAAALAATGDPRIAERGADLIDVGQRLAHAILGTVPAPIDVPPGSILLAEDLLPSQLAALDGSALGGIALSRGGPTSHVAIMAAGIGVPMVVAIGDVLDAVPGGAPVILDGDMGAIDSAPDAARLTAARARIEDAAAAIRIASAKTGPAATRDGRPVAVHVNLGDAADAAAGVAAGAEGCGLLRTELLFLERDTPPSRDEQAAAYRAVARALDDRPLTVRLLDIGGDKPARYLALPRQENPALGQRGVRVLLANPALLADQLAAIVDAGAGRIMVPMVTGNEEMIAIRAALRPLAGGRPVALGAMIETPAAAIGADLIAAECDFLSIGSNDLTQYALAMDRGNAAVAAGIDGLHPAVLRLIAATCEGAAVHGVPVGVCGGLAGDPLAVPILIGLGVTSLSVPPGRVAATRARVATIAFDAASRHARAALGCMSAAAVRDLARHASWGEPS